MKKLVKLSSLLIVIGVVTPAILSLYLISQFGLDTIFWDEFHIASIIKLFFEDGDYWGKFGVFSSHNEHLPIFPRLIILGMAHFTSYNTYYEIFVGWIFLSLTLFIFWKLLQQVNPEARWVIIPLAWMTFSYKQYETLLWGYPSIQWYLAIFCVVASFYFLNKIKNSKRFIVPAILFGIVGTFSHLVGVLSFFVGLNIFKNSFKNRKKLLSIFLIVLFSILFLYFSIWRNATFSIFQEDTFENSLSSFNDPVLFINFILSFLGNGIRIPLIGDMGLGLGGTSFAIIAGGIIISIFFTMNLLYHRLEIFRENNLQPWFHIALFGLLVAIISAIGRTKMIGLEGTMTPRYIPISNLFWEATIVFSVVVFIHLIKTANTKKQKTIFKICLGTMLIFLCVSIALGYVQGWNTTHVWDDRINIGTSCLLNLELTNEDCRILLPKIENYKDTITYLKENCLGPFSTLCK